MSRRGFAEPRSRALHGVGSRAREVLPPRPPASPPGLGPLVPCRVAMGLRSGWVARSGTLLCLVSCGPACSSLITVHTVSLFRSFCFQLVRPILGEVTFLQTTQLGHV